MLFNATNTCTYEKKPEIYFYLISSQAGTLGSKLTKMRAVNAQITRLSVHTNCINSGTEHGSP